MSKIIAQFQRELWENPTATKTAPLVAFCGISALVIILFACFQLVGTFNSTEEIFTNAEKVRQGLIGINFLFLALGIIFSLQYASGALLNDRRDQSILFFKSLPVSEWQVTLTRLAVAAFIIPVAALVGAFLTTSVYLLTASVFGSVSADLPIFHLFHSINPLYDFSVAFIKTILAGIWALPMFAWMFLASAWAKKHPVMIAALVLFFIHMIERWVFNSHVIGSLITAYSKGFSVGGSIALMPNMFDFNYTLTGVASFFLRPGLWLGLIIAALFMLGAVWLRNRRFEL